MTDNLESLLKSKNNSIIFKTLEIIKSALPSVLLSVINLLFNRLQQLA